jgi:hypothetical protein
LFGAKSRVGALCVHDSSLRAAADCPGDLEPSRPLEAAIAIISVLSSAAVAIVVAVLANRGETTRLGFQISAERLNELRAVLDEAASALRDALFAMNGIVSLLDQGLERALGDGPTVGELYAEFQGRRLGPSAELTRTYTTAVDACDAFFEVWGDRWTGGRYDAQAALRANQAVADGERAHEELLETASATVGPKVVSLRP